MFLLSDSALPKTHFMDFFIEFIFIKRRICPQWTHWISKIWGMCRRDYVPDSDVPEALTFILPPHQWRSPLTITWWCAILKACLVRWNDRIPKRLQDDTKKSERKERVIFNSPILSKAGIFFSVERQGTPLFHIPDNVHPGRSGHPLFFQDTCIHARVTGWHQVIQSIPYPDSIKYRK
jgi:hypothetical protein